MQRLITGTAFALLAALFVLLPSFSSKPGGEGFEIYLNNKLVLEQFGERLNTVKSFTIDPQYASGKLTVKYHHCGRVGKNRQLVIRDQENRLLKTWNFEDVASPGQGMSCNVSDILGLNKGNGPVTLKLIYSSSELPKGRQLASITTGSTAAVAKTK